MNEEDVVKTGVVTDTETITEEVTEVVEEPVKPGEKTDSALLLKSLQEEREKRRLVEEKLLALENQSPENNDVFSDEGKLLKQEISSLREKIEVKELLDQYPAIKDKSAEFNEFRTEYPGIPVDKIAKIFLAEKGLLEPHAPRKGLEKPSGGGKSIPTGEMTTEEVSNLRNNNFRKYMSLVKEGKIKV